jgi:hypothetical protein
VYYQQRCNTSKVVAPANLSDAEGLSRPLSYGQDRILSHRTEFLSPRLGELRFLARNAVPGIPHLNLGRTSRLHMPRLEPIIPLSRPLPSFTHLGVADS